MSTPTPDAPAPLAPPGRRMRLGQAATAWLYVDVVLAVLNVVTLPYLIGRLGAEPYGILGIVSVLAGQLGLLHFGVGTAATRLVAESVGKGGEGLAPRVAGVAVVAAVASLLVGAVFWLIAPSAWRSGFEVSPETLAIALASVPAAAALVAITPVTAAVYGVLAAREFYLFSAGLRLYHSAGRLIAAVAMVWLGAGVGAVLWAQALVDLTAVLAGAARAMGGLGPVAGALTGERRRMLRHSVVAVLTVGLPFALASLMSGLLTDAEKLAIGLARSVEDFTYYAVPFNVAIKFTAISGAVTRVLIPRIAMLAARDQGADTVVLVERADRILAIGMMAVIAPVVALLPELLTVWLGPEFAARSTLPIRIVLVGIVMNAAALPAHAVVLARGRLSRLNLLYAIEVVVHLAVVYVLVRRYGLVGAAAAWTLRVGLDLFAQRLLATHTLGIRLRGSALLMAAVGSLAVLAVAAGGLPLGFRLAAAAVLLGGGLLYLARGPDRALLVDSVLPWRWGVPKAD